MPEVGLLESYDGPLLLGKKVHTKNLLLINVIYHRPRKETKWEDACSIIVKDVSTGEKRLVTIKNPKMLMYIVKPEFRNYYHIPAYKKLDECYPKLIEYRKVLDGIVEAGG